MSKTVIPLSVHPLADGRFRVILAPLRTCRRLDIVVPGNVLFDLWRFRTAVKLQLDRRLRGAGDQAM